MYPPWFLSATASPLCSPGVAAPYHIAFKEPLVYHIALKEPPLYHDTLKEPLPYPRARADRTYLSALTLPVVHQSAPPYHHFSDALSPSEMFQLWGAPLAYTSTTGMLTMLVCSSFMTRLSSTQTILVWYSIARRHVRPKCGLFTRSSVVSKLSVFDRH